MGHRLLVVEFGRSTGSSFRLNGSAWEVPDFGNAHSFVEWLVRDDLLVMDPARLAALHGEPSGSSLRTLQRRFCEPPGSPRG